MNRSNVLRCAAWILPLALLPLPGCSNNGLTLGRVHGTVKYKGQPVKHGTVFFMPDESKATVGPPAMGIITSDGSYVMSTDESGDGAIVGSHLVGITGLDPTPVSDEVLPEPETNPDAYLKLKAKTAAASTRPSRKGGDLYTDRGGRKFRYSVPKKFSNPAESGIFAKVDRGSNTLNLDIDEAGNVRINP
jgi:hypothetical protein